jgi:hypothetical protein
VAAGSCPTQQAGVSEPTVGHGAMRVPPSVTMKAELQVLAAATASACDRVRLEAGDGDSVNFQSAAAGRLCVGATAQRLRGCMVLG